jgi:hypothetical protein
MLPNTHTFQNQLKQPQYKNYPQYEFTLMYFWTFWHQELNRNSLHFITKSLHISNVLQAHALHNRVTHVGCNCSCLIRTQLPRKKGDVRVTVTQRSQLCPKMCHLKARDVTTLKTALMRESVNCVKVWKKGFSLLDTNGFFTFQQVYRSKLLHGSRLACNREWLLLYTSLTDWFL